MLKRDKAILHRRDINSMRRPSAMRWFYFTMWGLTCAQLASKNRHWRFELVAKARESIFDKVLGRFFWISHSDLYVFFSPVKNSYFFSRAHYRIFTWNFNVGTFFYLDRNSTPNRLEVLSRAMEGCKPFVLGHLCSTIRGFPSKFTFWGGGGG